MQWYVCWIYIYTYISGCKLTDQYMINPIWVSEQVRLFTLSYADENNAFDRYMYEAQENV